MLPAIHVPTLVLADEDGAGYSAPENARLVAEMIPTARLVSFRSHDQHVWRAPARAILAETGAFIETLDSADAVHDRVLATVLFTDIVDSSARAAAAGDREWRGTRAQHDAIARASIARYRGREVKTLGDGFLVTFDAPGRGVRCVRSPYEPS